MCVQILMPKITHKWRWKIKIKNLIQMQLTKIAKKIVSYRKRKIGIKQGRCVMTYHYSIVNDDAGKFPFKKKWKIILMDQLNDRFPIRTFSLFFFIIMTTEHYNEFHTLMHKLNKDIFFGCFVSVIKKKSHTMCIWNTRTSPQQSIKTE